MAFLRVEVCVDLVLCCVRPSFNSVRVMLVTNEALVDSFQPNERCNPFW